MKTANELLMSTPGGGSSAVFGPDGRRLMPEVESTVETILYADLDMDQILVSKMFGDVLGHYSRPDLIWLSVSSDRR
jgi:nitrilase